MADKRFRLLAWLVLVYSLLVILWGYFLRISESGDGCGTDWPFCHGAVVPQGAAFPTWVEYIHRVSSGVVLILVLGMAIWAFRRFERGHALRWASGAALLLTLTESLFGAALVVFGLVAGDVSTARIVIRPFHVTNTFSLMAALALTAWWAERGVSRLPEWRGPQGRRFGGAALGLLVVAATGSWTGLAGTAFPAASVAEGIGQYLAPEHLLVYLRIAHPLIAVVVVVTILRLSFSVRRELADSPGSWVAGGVMAFGALQLLLGPFTVLLLYPTALRLTHLLAADLLWIGFLWLASERLALRGVPRPTA